MNATQALRGLGQSLWLDNITHRLLTSGTLGRYIRDDDTLAADLQRGGTAAFAKSWNELMRRIASKRWLP